MSAADDFHSIFESFFSKLELDFTADTADMGDFSEFKKSVIRLGYPTVDEGHVFNGCLRVPVLNAVLMWRYPFLMMRNRFSGETVTDDDDSPFTYNELDALPTAWVAAFALEHCEDVRTLLLRSNNQDALYGYSLMQLKEKMGQVRWYDDGVPEDVYDDFFHMIEAYAAISEQVCQSCGASRHVRCTHGWISYVCDKCHAPSTSDVSSYLDELLEDDHLNECRAHPWEDVQRIKNLAQTAMLTDSRTASRRKLAGHMKMTRYNSDGSVESYDLYESLKGKGLLVTDIVDRLDANLADDIAPEVTADDVRSAYADMRANSSDER